MRCKNCGHESELHDVDEGFCSGVMYERCDPHKPASPSVPMHCDCPVYEPEVQIAPLGHRSYRTEQRLQIIESLIEVESRSLAERGVRSSKRLRKLEQALTRLHLGSGDEIPELRNNDLYAEFEETQYQDEPIAPDNSLKSAFGDLKFRIGEKGGVSVYGLGRFPVTLYYDQWMRLLASADELQTFLEANRTNGKLKLKVKTG